MLQNVKVFLSQKKGIILKKMHFEFSPLILQTFKVLAPRRQQRCQGYSNSFGLSKFLHHDGNDNAKAVAIPPVFNYTMRTFSKSSRKGL